MRFVRSVLLTLVILFAAIAARAEQKVLMFHLLTEDIGQIEIPHQVVRLLSLGWKVTCVSSCGMGGLNGRQTFVLTFVLESPVAAPVKP